MTLEIEYVEPEKPIVSCTVECGENSIIILQKGYMKMCRTLFGASCVIIPITDNQITELIEALELIRDRGVRI